MKPAHAMFALMIGASLAGCAGPNKSNIALRKTIAEQEKGLNDLAIRLKNSEATVATLKAQAGPPVEHLGDERLGKLVTVDRIQLGRLTGGVDKDPTKPGDEILGVYLEPLDKTGDVFKTAGTATVELFDLSENGKMVGEWKFTTEEVFESWIGVGLLYDFVLNCPWQGEPPTSEKLTVRVVFTDELTGRSFEATKEVRVKRR